MFSMLGVFAEFERAIIVERVQAGLQRARAQGKQLGRPTVSRARELRIEQLRAKGKSRAEIEREVGEDREVRIRALRATGKGIISIAREVGCGVSVVQRVIAAA